MARKHPDRPPYVAQPRDLGRQPAFQALSRDAQWLLQELERDPFRLACGVFEWNPRRAAKAAKATLDEVEQWFEELAGAGFLLVDDDTDEVWLTFHMDWDFTLIAENNAKGILRELKRVSSVTLTRKITALVLVKYPQLRGLSLIDPEWIDPEEPGSDPVRTPFPDPEEPGSDPVVSGAGDSPALATAPASSTEPEPGSTKKGANSRKQGAQSTQPPPGARSPGLGATPPSDGAHPAELDCSSCDDLGILGDSRPCTECDRGRSVAAQLLDVVP